MIRYSSSEEAAARAFLLYEGKAVPHRSCGIALAETFGLPTASYQSLRRGGITGEGPCGAIQAGILVLGEILGDPSPEGGVTPELKAAIPRYREFLKMRLGGGDPGLEVSCNARTAPQGDFFGEARKQSCTRLVGDVAWAIAEVLRGGR
jgi:hypothetical protein